VEAARNKANCHFGSGNPQIPAKSDDSSDSQGFETGKYLGG
jgi:hypothetical protein